MYRNASATLRNRLLRQVDARDLFGCWPFLGVIGANGYGKIRVGGRGSTYAPAHRVAYWLLVLGGEQLADDDPRMALEVDHTCENRACCNPAHLQLLTPHENKFYRYNERGTYKPPQGNLTDEDYYDMDELMNEVI